ncbi:MAG TPA: cobalamin-binding protein [Planctomycetota bacterium]|nr:cobalamin-binding protein [Planctomycetota bacterium]
MTLPKRIVSLCPSLTETLFAIGAGERVVGVTEYCTRPEAEVADLPKVGGTKTPDLERIFRLEPDLVVVNEEENRLPDVEVLRARGIPLLETFPKGALGAAATVRSMGRRIGGEARAEELALEIERARAEVASASAGKPRVRLACLVWRAPYMTVNRDTYVHDLLETAGAENLFAQEAERYSRISPERLRDVAPEAVLLTSEPYPFTALHAAEVRALCGLPSGRAVLVDGELLTWYGPRTPEGLRYAARVLDRLRAGG